MAVSLIKLISFLQPLRFDRRADQGDSAEYPSLYRASRVGLKLVYKYDRRPSES